MDYYSGNSWAGSRYIVNNLVIGNITAVTTLEVQVTLPGVKVGDSGFACPRDAKFTDGVGINPIRVTADNTAQIPFVNGSAGAINPADTFDFDVYIFRATGAVTTVA